MEQVREMTDRLGANLLVVVTDREELLKAALERSRLPILLATGSRELMQEYAPRVRQAFPLLQPLSGTASALVQVKELLLGAFFHGVLSTKDAAIVVVSAGDAIDLVRRYDVGRDVEIAHVHEALDDRVDLP